MIRCVDCQTLVDNYIRGRCLSCHELDQENDDDSSAAAESDQQAPDALAELGARDPEDYECGECYETCPSCKRDFSVRYMTKPAPGWPSVCFRCDDEGPPSE